MSSCSAQHSVSSSALSFQGLLQCSSYSERLLSLETPIMSNATSYKQLKEDFVSNLSGGSVTEISYVTAVAPVGVSSSNSLM